ncbi:MAG: hypothetical protein IJO04_05050 [Oscillospiraceae bacterium]|nr:hypothetical protein [Oscillospiraceae bacterium]
MLVRRNACPADYRLCDQMVTVYHKNGDLYTRTVHTNVYLDERKNLTVDKTGSKEANSFLLIIPGNTQAVFVGDKVLRGFGPEIADSKAWAAFIPSKVPGLVVVDYVDCKYWQGQIVHTEAGG